MAWFSLHGADSRPIDLRHERQEHRPLDSAPAFRPAPTRPVFYVLHGHLCNTLHKLAYKWFRPRRWACQGNRRGRLIAFQAHLPFNPQNRPNQATAHLLKDLRCSCASQGSDPHLLSEVRPQSHWRL